MRYARPHAYYTRGLYADFLQRYFAIFRRGQLLCLNFDDLRQRPSWLAAKVHRFLDVQERREDALDVGVLNSAEPRAEPMPDDVRCNLAERYAEPNRRLKSLLGDGFASWVDNDEHNR